MLQDAPSAAPLRLELWDGVALGDPVFLVLLPVALVAVYLGHRRASRARITAPLPGSVGRPGLRTHLLFLPVLFEALALLLAVGALARPVEYDILESTVSEGVDIVLAVDRSGSMELQDLEPGRSRLDVVKEVVGEFARRRMTDEEGASDNVALLSFARYPELRCPFTLDVDALFGFLEQVELVRYEAEDGTAIGSALAKAVALFEGSDSASKVAVLLTDGQNTLDDILPSEALAMAEAAEVRVHTIHAARYVYVRDPFGGIKAIEEEPDTSLLEEIAERTGGSFFRARDKENLEEIYAEIERLERTPRKDERRIETRDRYPLLLGAALAAFALARLLTALGLRRTA